MYRPGTRIGPRWTGADTRGELRWSGGPAHELLGPVGAGVDRLLHLGGDALDLLDDRLDPLAEVAHEGLDPTADVLAGRARLGAQVVGERLQLDPTVLGTGREVGVRLLRLVRDLLLHLTAADLALLERGHADAHGDVGGVLECLAGVEVHDALSFGGRRRASSPGVGLRGSASTPRPPGARGRRRRLRE